MACTWSCQRSRNRRARSCGSGGWVIAAEYVTRPGPGQATPASGSTSGSPVFPRRGRGGGERSRRLHTLPVAKQQASAQSLCGSGPCNPNRPKGCHDEGAADGAMADKTRTSRTQTGRPEGAENVMTIKKYANRRLYNTATSSYVTLDHLCQMVKDDVDFVVYDAKTGEDITRAVLTQIIVEEENKGQTLLPINLLRQLIGFYGDNLQMVVPRYLETAMSTFADNQERMRSYMQEAFGGQIGRAHV